MYEPNDDTMTATVVTVPCTTYDASLCLDGTDVDFFAFDVMGAQDVDALMRSSISGNRWTVEIRDTDGVTVLSTTTDTADGKLASASLPGAGRYYAVVRVTTAHFIGIGYNLTIDF